ncbi:MAG: ERF family protein [Treponema sp.]|nr:ERF family protein [Treponema sp.]
MEALKNIQAKLKVPKNLINSFGNYKYRNAEAILEAVKPLLTENGAELFLTDDIVAVGDRVYVKATATLRTDTESVSAVGFAREPLEKKGSDASQITGAASSYARKYALNGLFLIDDAKDADSDENRTEADAREKAAADGELKELALTIEGYETNGLIPKEWKPKVDLYIKNKDIKGLKGVIDYCKKQSA